MGILPKTVKDSKNGIKYSRKKLIKAKTGNHL
jgi:hypothetical protein